MNLNLNDEKFAVKESKIIFNGGDAGYARKCAASIKSVEPVAGKTMPKYQLVFIDENGGEVNRGLFELKADASQGSIDFFGKEMMHLMKHFDFTITNMNTTPEDILKQVAMGVNKNAKGKKFGVAVCFGTEKRTNSFLEVDGFWGYKREDIIEGGDALKLSKNAVLVRPQPSMPPQGPAPTAEGIANGEFDLPATGGIDDGSDLPF